MSALPALDLHAHVDPRIEADRADCAAGHRVRSHALPLTYPIRHLERSDGTTIWGVGCHPGLLGVHHAFDSRAHVKRSLRQLPTWASSGSMELHGFLWRCSGKRSKVLSERTSIQPAYHIPAQLQGHG